MNAPPKPADHALRGILLTNAVTLGLALVQQWSLLELLWPFWLQSVIIGWYARQRILKLQQFSTEGFRINDRAVEPTPETRRSTANFFALHYGIFHLVYFMFLMSATTQADADGYFAMTGDSGGVIDVHVGHLHVFDLLAYLILAVGFWRSHRASHLEHVAADLAGRPNIGTLMFMPYARVIPMHLTIILAGPLGGGGALWLFVLLKTAADVGMHKLEHHVLRRARHANVTSSP